MAILADSVNIIDPALGGNIISRMEEPGNRSLLKWKLQVKLMTTRITVVRRFARTYRAKSFQYGTAPGSTAASPQITSKAKDQGSKTRILPTEALDSRALFSPNTPVQDGLLKQKDELRTSEKKNGEEFFYKMGDFFNDHRTSTIQLLLTLFAVQILKESDLPEEAIGGLVIVTVIFLASRQEGTTATYNPVARQTVLIKGLRLFLYLSGFEKIGVYAQDEIDDGKREYQSEPVDLPFNVQEAAWTFVAVIVIALIAGRINCRPAVPPVAAAPPAVPVPAIGMGFVNVGDVLDDNPGAARITDSNFHILPRLQLD